MARGRPQAGETSVSRHLFHSGTSPLCGAKKGQAEVSCVLPVATRSDLDTLEAAVGAFSTLHYNTNI